MVKMTAKMMSFVEYAIPYTIGSRYPTK